MVSAQAFGITMGAYCKKNPYVVANGLQVVLVSELLVFKYCFGMCGPSWNVCDGQAAYV